jgi:DNA repair protein RecO (recombination protein O)
MSRTYKATGINLKTMPLGESDRLLTILTPECGLVRAVAMGSRKHNSRLGGRSGLFVVNELLIAKGRSLDKVAQAETIESYPGLGQDLTKLTASQYLAELALFQALSDQPQAELFTLLNEQLKRLERSPTPQVLAALTFAMFQLLTLAGISPQVHLCCVTREPLTPNFSDPNWRIGFSIPAGGVVTLEVLERLQAEQRSPRTPVKSGAKTAFGVPRVAELAANFGHSPRSTAEPQRRTEPDAALPVQLTAAELFLLQQLGQPDPPDGATIAAASSLQNDPLPDSLWLSVERLLRHYAQFHFDRPIRSASLIDACFLPISTCSHLPEP